MGGSKRLSKDKRNALRAGEIQPETPKEVNWLAGQHAKKDAGGRLPLTATQVEHDQYHASRRRMAEAQHADFPRSSRTYQDRAQLAFNERDYSSRSEYEQHSRASANSMPRYRLEHDRDAHLRRRMPSQDFERSTRSPRYDRQDARPDRSFRPSMEEDDFRRGSLGDRRPYAQGDDEYRRRGSHDYRNPSNRRQPQPIERVERLHGSYRPSMRDVGFEQGRSASRQDYIDEHPRSSRSRGHHHARELPWPDRHIEAHPDMPSTTASSRDATKDKDRSTSRGVPLIEQPDARPIAATGRLHDPDTSLEAVESTWRKLRVSMEADNTANGQPQPSTNMIGDQEEPPVSETRDSHPVATANPDGEDLDRISSGPIATRLLTALADFGINDQKSVNWWKRLMNTGAVETLPTTLSDIQKLEVVFCGNRTANLSAQKDNDTEVQFAAVTDEMNLLMAITGREVETADAFCRWYTALKYPDMARPLLSNMKLDDWPCMHNVSVVNGHQIPVEVLQLARQTTICKCRHENASAAPQPSMEPADSDAGQGRGHDETSPPDTFSPIFIQDDRIEDDEEDRSNDNVDWIDDVFESAIQNAIDSPANKLDTSKDSASKINTAEDQEAARKLAAEEAKKRREKSIREKQAKEATVAANKEQNLLDGVKHLASTRSRLERQADSGTNAFAAPMLQVIDYYCEALRQEAVADVFSKTLTIHGVQLPFLESILAIDPKSEDLPWAGDDMITYLLENVLASGVPRDQYLITAPTQVHMFFTGGLDNEEAAKEFEVRLQENKALHGEGRMGVYLAESMSSECHSLHFVWNPPGNHWLVSSLLVDLAANTGRIILRNSQHHGGLLGASTRRALHDLPYLAKLASQRPGLDWDSIVWSPVEEAECARQINSNDCGFLACDTIRRIIKGEELYLPESFEDREAFGRRLRWQALSCIVELFTGQALGEIPDDNEEEISSASSTSSKSDDDSDDDASADGQEEQVPSTRPSLGGTCGACERDKLVCDGRFPCATCASSGAFCWYNDLTETLAEGRNIRTHVCDRLLNGSASVEEIVDYLKPSYEDKDIDIEQLTQRVGKIMSHPGNSSLFVADDDMEGSPMNETYSLSGAFGHAVHTDRLYTLLGSKGHLRHVDDDLDLDVALIISVIRHSGAHRRNDRAQRSLERAEQLMIGHHTRFSRQKGQPVRVESPEDLERAAESNTRSWTPQLLEPGSSNKPYPGDHKRGQVVPAMLERLEEVAGRASRRPIVVILFNGIDGLTSNNNSWKSLIEQYPSLDIRLTMLLPSTYFPGNYGRLEDDMENVLVWVHLETRILANLYDANAGPGFHICKHQDLDPTGSDEIEINCARCTSETGIWNHEWCWSSADRSVQDLHKFYCHTRFICLIEMVGYLKLDFSVFYRHHGFVRNVNSLASALTADRRNELELPELDNMKCDRCGDADGPFKRSDASMVGLRCAPDCDSVVSPEREQVQPASPGQILTGVSTRYSSPGDEIIVAPYEAASAAPRPLTLESGSANQASEHKFQCLEPNCGARYSRACNLGLHVQVTHRGQYKCTEQNCHGFAFASKRALARHRRALHRKMSKQGPAKCDLCDEIFVNRKARNVHMAKQHQGGHRCLHVGCTRQFAFHSKRALQCHANAFHGAGKHKCRHPGCSYSAADGRNFLSHMQKIHDVHMTTLGRSGRLAQNDKSIESAGKRPDERAKAIANASGLSRKRTQDTENGKDKLRRKRGRYDDKETDPSTNTTSQYGLRPRAPKPATDDDDIAHGPSGAEHVTQISSDNSDSDVSSMGSASEDE